MKSRKAILLLFSLFAFLHLSTANKRDLIQQQFTNYYTSGATDDANAEKLLSTIQADGTWSNIDYTSKRRGDWPTLVHLKNCVTMSTAYAQTNSKYYKSPELLSAILAGIKHWLDKDYANPNWWQSKIGIPENLCISLILLDNDLPKEVLRRAQTGPLKRTKIGMTGQNKVWLSGIAFMKGHLANNQALMQEAAASIWEELMVSTNEGIQPDWSFHQHGPQQQFGNYGLSFGARMIMWASILNNTQYALSGEKLETFRNYQLHGASWVQWNGYLDYSACGRQLEAGSQAQKARGINQQLLQMQSIDPKFKKEYKKRLSKTNRLIGHKSFWRSEMSVHRTKNWYASIKMSSTRIIGAETCNSENMQGLHEGDGTLLLYKSGKEYEDIIPLWDWNRLPGSTCDQKYGDLTPLSWNKGYGGTDFSGVIGDGKMGFAALKYSRRALKANKSYFFTDEGIICLGSNIDGKSKGEVFTSVQQAWLKGDVISSNGTLKKGKTELKKDEWLLHDGIGYHLLNPVSVQLKTVADDWTKCYPDRGTNPVTGNVFSVWINHGNNPKSQSYAYSIYPNSNVSKLKKAIEKSKTTILSNTANVQAIENNKGIQASFFEAGELILSNGFKLKVNNSCLLILTKKSIFVSDPIHKTSSISIDIDGKTYKIDFPTGDEKGKTVEMKR